MSMFHGGSVVGMLRQGACSFSRQACTRRQLQGLHSGWPVFNSLHHNQTNFPATVVHWTASRCLVLCPFLLLVGSNCVPRCRCSGCWVRCMLAHISPSSHRTGQQPFCLCTLLVWNPCGSQCCCFVLTVCSIACAGAVAVRCAGWVVCGLTAARAAAAADNCTAALDHMVCGACCSCCHRRGNQGG
jgi:hypothetical protein